MAFPTSIHLINLLGLDGVSVVKTFGVGGGVGHIAELVPIVLIIQVVDLNSFLLAFQLTISFQGQNITVQVIGQLVIVGII